MATAPRVSVIILNYNGGRWNQRCLASLRAQTAFAEIEVIFADNASTDDSFREASGWLRDWPNARAVSNGANLGYCGGNNRAATHATGEWFFFLNGDTWLEPDCLARLLDEAEAAGAAAATPLMLNYADNSVQSTGGAGFDPFGLMALVPTHAVPAATREVFVAGGCSYLIRRGWFQRLGGFDEAFFMYADEYDLSWRVWLTGGKIVIVPGARLHHRGAADVNPEGGAQVVELRTSDSKRFYSNRNCLLVPLKNAQHLLLLTIPLQLAMLAAEALASLALVRRGSFVRRAYLGAVLDAWKLRGHVAAERRKLRSLRQRSDFAMLRFLSFRLNRWDEFRNIRRLGLPKVSAR